MNDFQLFAPFTKIAKQSDGTIKCHSVVHDETLDDQGEVIDYEGGRAAIDDFMKWANVREMHGEVAVGVVETIVHDDAARASEGVLHIVDPIAVQKVETGVYKGTSWGGMKGTQRALEKIGGHTATRLLAPTFIELSLVDRPSRPTAVLTLMKRSVAPATEGDEMAKTAKAAEAVVPRGNITAPPAPDAAAPAAPAAPATEPLAKAAADDLLDSHMLAERLAGAIEQEAGEESPNTARIAILKTMLASAQELDVIAAGELGTPEDVTEAAAEEADEDEDEADSSDGSGTTVILAAAAKIKDLRKIGARNAAQDQAALNQILALSIQLGAQPPEPVAEGGAVAAPPPAAPAPAAAPMGKVAGPTVDAYVDGVMDRLSKSSVFARVGDLEAMKADLLGALRPIQEELAKVAAQPAPGGPLRYAQDPRGLYGPAAAGPTNEALSGVLAKVSDPRLREELGLAIAAQEIAAART